MALIACFLFIRYAFASFDSHYLGQRSSAHASLRITLLCKTRTAQVRGSVRLTIRIKHLQLKVSEACRPAQRLLSAPHHVQLLSNVRYIKSVATACVSHLKAFTTDQVSQE